MIFFRFTVAIIHTVAILSIILVSSCANKGKQERPNFIIFIADDAAWDDSGAYGNSGIQTPNIDDLAIEGLLFTNAFITTSSCSPSRCSIMTGLYPHNTGAMELHMPLPKSKSIFTGELQKVGYYTASAGKWHLGPNRSEFDTIFHPREASGAADWLTALNTRPKDKPFFFWFAAIDPHRGYEEGIISNPHKNEEVTVPPFLPDNKMTRKDLALYYDEIARLDSNLGSVMKALKRQGIDKNTMVIYMTDNGRPFPRCKTRLLDSGLKTPFIVRWPDKIDPKTVTHSLISSIDIAPTICELAGVEIPDYFQGVSFAAIIADPSVETREYVVGEHNWHDYQAHERALRTKDFLYIRNAFPEFNASPPADAVGSITYQEMIRLYNEGNLEVNYRDCFLAPRNTEELYDIKNDPFQQNDLSGDNNFQSILGVLRNNLDQWAQDTEDQVPSQPTPDMFDRFTGKKLRDINDYRMDNTEL